MARRTSPEVESVAELLRRDGVCWFQIGSPDSLEAEPLLRDRIYSAARKLGRKARTWKEGDLIYGALI